jgi:hypothetical protein
MSSNDLRELFLIFAIKRKIKLMSYLLYSDDFDMKINENNFIEFLENSAYDVGVLI